MDIARAIKTDRYILFTEESSKVSNKEKEILIKTEQNRDIIEESSVVQTKKEKLELSKGAELGNDKFKECGVLQVKEENQLLQHVKYEKELTIEYGVIDEGVPVKPEIVEGKLLVDSGIAQISCL